PVPRPQVPLTATPVRPSPAACSASQPATSSGPGSVISTSNVPPTSSPGPAAADRPAPVVAGAGRAARPADSVRQRGVEAIPQDPELEGVEELVDLIPVPRG